MAEPQKLLDWWAFLQVASPTLLITILSVLILVVLAKNSLVGQINASFTELGKIEGRLESFDSILAEVRATTKAQESIKQQQLSGEWWERQNRWNEKRNIYAGLMMGFFDLKTAYSDLCVSIELLAQQGQDDMVQAVVNERIAASLAKIEQLRTKIGHQIGLAQLFLDSRINLTVWQFYHNRPQMGLSEPLWIAPIQASINEAMEGIVRLAKEDLRLTDPGT